MTIDEHLNDFFGKPVKDYDEGTAFDIAAACPRISLDWNRYEKKVTWGDLLKDYLAHGRNAETTHLVAGAPEGFEGDMRSDMHLPALIANAKALSRLEALFLGDITYDECELSWINPGDLSALWPAFPNLRAFAVRGYPGEMGKIALPKLESFTIQCSGLTKADVAAVYAAQVPALTSLEIWTGDDNYNAETDAGDWAKLLSGAMFPKLKHLGLRDCQYADDLAAAVAKSPLIERLESLDLSLGTLGDEGAEALLASPAVKRLKKLDLHYHYMSEETIARFKSLGPVVNVDDQQQEEDYGRNVAVAE